MVRVPGEAGPWSRVGLGVNDVHFDFSLFILFASVHFLSFVVSFTFSSERSLNRFANFMNQSFSGLRITLKLSAGLTALPHSSIYFE